jgi:hypothetical protein
MAELNDNDTAPIKHNFHVDLQPGDVALVLRYKGEPEIHHNIASLAETGVLQSEHAAEMIMGLSMVNIVSFDEPAFIAAMTRVTMLLESGKLRLVQ